MRAARLLWAKLIKRRVQAEGRPLAGAAHALPDHRAGASPRRTCSTTSRAPCIEAHGGDAGPHAVAAHQRARRGDRAADRLLGPHRPQHAAALQQETGTCRVIDPWGGSYYVERLTYELARKALAHIEEVERARRHGQGDRRRHPEDAHRGGRRAHAGAHRQRHADHRRRQQVPRRPTRPRSTSSRSTTRAVREQQIAKLQRLRGERDEKVTQAALDGADRRRARQRQPARARGRGGARQGDRRRDLRCHGEGVRPPPRRDPRHLRRLPVGGRSHEQGRRARCCSWSRRSTRTRAAGRAS